MVADCVMQTSPAAEPMCRDTYQAAAVEFMTSVASPQAGIANRHGASDFRISVQYPMRYNRPTGKSEPLVGSSVRSIGEQGANQ